MTDVSLPISFLRTVKLAAAALAVAATIAATALPAASQRPPKTYIAVLNAAQEPQPSTAVGNALLTLDSANMLCFYIGYNGLTTAEILAHIHGPALPGVPAGIIFPLPAGNPKTGCVGPLSGPQKKELNKKLWYINIHTTMFPAGEIRGQILRVK